MNKREFLRILPLAALTATTVSVGDVEAQVHELNPEKKYLIVIPDDIEPDNGERVAAGIRERLGSNVAIVAGGSLRTLKVYELA